MWNKIKALVRPSPGQSTEGQGNPANANPQEALDQLRLGKRKEAAGALDEARRCFENAVRLNPESADAFFCLGTAYWRLGRVVEAGAMFSRSVELGLSDPAAHHNLGNALILLGKWDDAEASFRQALSIKPNFTPSRLRIAHIYQRQRRLEQAAAELGKAREIDPKNPDAVVALAALHRSLCDWQNFAAEEAEVLAIVRKRQAGFPPHLLMRFAATPRDQLVGARNRAVRLNLPRPAQYRFAPPLENRKIRLGYLSGDFRRHATAHLVAELFELHDRSSFDVIGYSLGPDDGSPIRRRLVKAFDQFVDLSAMAQDAAADLIHRDQVDILIDLNGFTENNGMRTLARRPAPIQVNYLGYPGTVGVDFIDYIIADPVVLPFDQRRFFSEKIVHLPDSYQVNDRKRPIAAKMQTRAQHGLPSQGLVFCAFHQPEKITPMFFGIWMRLLKDVDLSVLWLLDSPEATKSNLRREATNHGVDPQRLVFAPRMELPEHLARHRLADLYLDTHPCNAHTSLSDALWAGLPGLTLIGTTFAGRVAASLLRAVGLPELVTETVSAYEDLALDLARQSARLVDAKKRLAYHRTTAPLFDTPRYTRHLEVAYRRMWQTFCRGRRPEEIAVTASAGPPTGAPSQADKG